MLQRAPVAEGQLLFEFALNAWRLLEGVPAALVRERTGIAPDARCEPWKGAIEAGLLAFDGKHVRPTSRGACFLNDLTALFLPEDDAR